MEHAELASQANDCRRAGRLFEAEALFRDAAAALPPGVEGLELAHLLTLESSLDRDRMDYRAAVQKLDKARHIYRLHRCEREIARCELKRGMVYEDRGEHESAQAEYAAAWERLGEGDDLRVIAAYNIVDSEVALGRVVQARAMFENLRPSARVMELEGDPLCHRRRLDWIEAQIMLGEGRTVAAREILTAIAEEYAGAMNTLFTARVFVDLAECAEKLGCQEDFDRASTTLMRLLAAAGVRQGSLALNLVFARMANRRCSEAVVRMLLKARRPDAR